MMGFAWLLSMTIFPVFMPRTAVHSWPDTLTDWCVIRAFEKAGCPGYLRKPPALAAAFVAEVSSAIRLQTFSLRTVELLGQLQTAAELAYEQAGGSAYRALRDAAAAAEDAHLETITDQGGCPRQLVHRQRCEAELATCRHRFASQARTAQRRCARAYWAKQRQQWLRPDLVILLPYDHPILRLATLTPVWWALFIRCLHAEFSRHDLPSTHLLNELPRLRRQARAGGPKILAGLVEDWRAAHADELGLPVRLHYHVLKRRCLPRARYARAWFRSRLPGYQEGYVSRATICDLLEAIPSPRNRDWMAN